MNDDERPDPDAMTQPLPVVSYRPPPPAEPVAPPAAQKAKAEKAPYAPIFGNLAAYAFSRFAALVFDFAIVPTIFACFLFNAADRGTLAFAPRTLGGFTAIAGLGFLGAIVFAMLFEAIFETTIGKALFGLGVRRGNGAHAGPQRIVLRYVLLPVDLVVIGEILALVTRRHQRLGDFAAGTVVARHRSGGFVTAFALVLFAGLVYAQAVAGGGLGSILLVTTEASYFVPTIVGNGLAAVGLGSRPAEPPPLPTANASAVPSDEPSPSPSDPAAMSAPPDATPEPTALPTNV